MNQVLATSIRNDLLDAGHELIGDVAERYGVSCRTLRYYEECGLLRPLRVGQVRLYNAADRQRIHLFLQGRKLGFSLREVAMMVESCETSVNRSGDILDYLTGPAIYRRLEELRFKRDALTAAIQELREEAAGT